MAPDDPSVADLLERLDQQRRTAARLREQAEARRNHAVQLCRRAEVAARRARRIFQRGLDAQSSLGNLRELNHVVQTRDEVRRIADEIRTILHVKAERAARQGDTT